MLGRAGPGAAGGGARGLGPGGAVSCAHDRGAGLGPGTAGPPPRPGSPRGMLPPRDAAPEGCRRCSPLALAASRAGCSPRQHGACPGGLTGPEGCAPRRGPSWEGAAPGIASGTGLPPSGPTLRRAPRVRSGGGVPAGASGPGRRPSLSRSFSRPPPWARPLPRLPRWPWGRARAQRCPQVGRLQPALGDSDSAADGRIAAAFG